MKVILALIFVLLDLNSYVQAEYSNEELMKMNFQSLRADLAANKAYSTGIGRIIQGKPNAEALARRAALSDARRGLLILRRELKEGRPRRSDDVSGYIPPVKIISEEESGDIYIVEVEVVLSELMREREQARKYVREPESLSYDKKEIYEVYETENYDEEKEGEDEYEDDDDEYFPNIGSLLNKHKRGTNRNKR